ncbi:MAG: helix-turn-helix transcriptional regulator [Spirochaetes bacterium]|nr:helix-turn-helix transcriptional regulator [Spirochaetota bacterium]
MKSFRHVYGLEPGKKNERFRAQVAGFRWAFERPSLYPQGMNAWSFIHSYEPITVHTPDGAVSSDGHAVMIFPPGLIMHMTAAASRTRQTWLRVVGTSVPLWIRENGLNTYEAMPMGSADISERYVLAADRELACPDADNIIVEHILCAWLREIRRMKGSSLPVPDAIRAVYERMRAGFTRPLTTAELAADAGYSRAYFIEQFTHWFGIPPMKYLTRLRMEHARYLLEDARMPVGDIARECGYTDVFHFSKAFKLHTGASPRQFRLTK